jgi:hypothetical protein
VENDIETSGSRTENDITVDTFRSEDAEGIVRLFRAVYGENYPIQLFYDPEAIVAANREGRYHSVVARTQSGEIVGVTHVFPSAPSSAIFEAGLGMVLKEYRNAGVNGRILDFIFEEFAPNILHVEELYGEAVCNHTIQQKNMVRYKFVEPALEIALMPVETYRKEQSAAGRVAALNAFRCYRPRPHRIYLPAAYEPILRRIYALLDDVRDIAVSSEKAPDGAVSRGDLKVFDFARVARITVQEIGSDIAEFLSDMETRCFDQNAVVLQARVNLATPWVGEAVNCLRNMGYFFGGAQPRWFDTDGFLMQKLLCPPDFDGIQLLTDFSRQLLEFIREDWQRAGGRMRSSGQL